MVESNFVSESDFEKLLDSIPIQSHLNTKMSAEDWRFFFRVMYGCALRVKETTRLKPEDFDCEHRILTLNETKTGWKKLKDGQKIRKAQRTSILPQDAEDLKAYLKDKTPDLLLWPISRQTAWMKFKQLCETSGLSYFWQKDERAFLKGWPTCLEAQEVK